MRNGCSGDDWRVVPLTAQGVTVFKSPDPEGVSLAHPSIIALKSGRLIVSFDLAGPGVKKLGGLKGRGYASKHWVQGRMLVSDDAGGKWSALTDFPFCAANLFPDGTSLYALGHTGNLRISRSYDGGNTWSRAEDLTAGDDTGAFYVRRPGNVLIHDGRIHMAFMWLTDPHRKGEAADALAPVVMSARSGSVLTKHSAWTFSSPRKSFRDLVPEESLDFFGVPFLAGSAGQGNGKVGPRQHTPPIGWHQAHVVPVVPGGDGGPPSCLGPRCIIAAARTHRSNLAALLGINESGGGSAVELIRTPAGKPWVFVPLPGGHLEFDIMYDEPSGLYWLLGAQGMDRTGYGRSVEAGGAGGELGRLQLHFSQNLLDWRFAGLVAVAGGPEVTLQQSRMTVRGNDLCVVSCETDADAPRIKHTDLVTLRIVRDFRALTY